MSRSLFIIATVLLATAFLLFFPIVITTDVHYDMNEKKMGFAVSLYKRIPMIGGYIETYRGGLAIHVSSKKATVIPYSDMNGERKRFSFFKSFHVIGGTLTTETGAEYLLPISVVHIILRIFFFINGGNKENIENNLWLTDGDVLKVSMHLAVYFNLFMLICAFIKFLKEKIQIICRKKMRKSIA